jgi:poly(A) polymerase
MPDPSGTVSIMLDRDILKGVLPEIGNGAVASLRSLIAAERESAVEPDALRRFAALLPRDSATAENVAARLRLSNKARKRLACAAGADLDQAPRALAYRLGTACAVDRLLLAGRPADAAAIAAWHSPRLPVSGGALIKRGVPEGPLVARTLCQIEDRWVDEGFPTGAEFEGIVSSVVAAAIR